MRGTWIIAGAMKINRVLTDAEVDGILRDNGIAPMPRAGSDSGILASAPSSPQDDTETAQRVYDSLNGRVRPRPANPYEAEDAQFAADVGAVAGRTYTKTQTLKLGTTPQPLLLAGLDPLPLVMPPHVVIKATEGKPDVAGEHYLPLDIIKRLPTLLRDPVAVAPSESEGDGFVVILEAMHKGKPVITALHANRRVDMIEVNRIASVYERKSRDAILRWIENALYFNRKKARDLLRAIGVQYSKVGTNHGKGVKIYTDADLVNPDSEASQSGTSTAVPQQAQILAALDAYASLHPDKKSQSGVRNRAHAQRLKAYLRGEAQLDPADFPAATGADAAQNTLASAPSAGRTDYASFSSQPDSAEQFFLASAPSTPSTPSSTTPPDPSAPPDLSGASGVVHGELFKLGRDLYGSKRPVGGYESEGWAEFFRLYVLDPEKAEALAPETAKWFKRDVLDLNPMLAKAVAETQEAGVKWQRQGAKARAIASIGKKQLSAREIVTNARRRLLDRNKLTRMWVESAASLQDFVEEAEQYAGRKFTDDENPFAILTARRLSADSKALYMATKGMLDFNGNRVGPALQNAFAGLHENGKVQDFILYLWARRSIALWDDPNGPRNPGLTQEDAQQLMAELDNPDFATRAQLVYDWNAGVLNYAASASPAYAKLIERIREVDPGSYIPLFREFDELDRAYRDTGGGGSGGGGVQKNDRHFLLDMLIVILRMG
jgi:hypothetical protein